MSSKIAGPQTLNVFRVYDADTVWLPLYPQNFSVETMSGAPNGPCDYCEHTIQFYTRSTLYNGPSVIGISPIELVIPPTSDLQSEKIFHSTDLQLLVGVDGEKICMDVGAGGRFTVWGRNVTVNLLVPVPPAIAGYPSYIVGNFPTARDAYRDGGLPTNIVVVNDFVSVTLGTCQVSGYTNRPRLTRVYQADLIEQESQGANVFRIPDRAAKVTFYGSIPGEADDTIDFYRDGQFPAIVRSIPVLNRLPIDVPGNARYFSINVEDQANIITAIWELDL